MDFAGGDATRRVAVLGFDSDGLADALDRLRLPPGGADPELESLDGDLGRAWLSLMRGEAEELEAGMVALFSRAAASRDPARVIEATALRAMVALSRAKLAEAVALARRASMMSRTEALPPSELFANLVLARVRRKSGKPHLAARIVEALARLAPGALSGWLDWERLLAGGVRVEAPPGDESTPAARAVAAGRGLLLAARAGDRPAFEREAERLLAATAGFRDMRDEAEALVALLDVGREPPEALRAFKHGDSAELASGLFGAVVVGDDEEPGITVFATARPGERGGRVLRDGLGLLGPCRMVSSDDGARRTQGRTDAALAALTLAIPGSMPEERFFARVYGFAYVPAKHRGALDTLLHRMRARIGPGGVVVRAEGCLRLDLAEPIAVADPHCSPPAAARILSALSRQRLATADDIATRLGITVRAAQMALQQLVTDGACTARRSGRRMEYQLQDTTFSEPTSPDALANRQPA
jgi:hypothetical protein